MIGTVGFTMKKYVLLLSVNFMLLLAVVFVTSHSRKHGEMLTCRFTFVSVPADNEIARGVKKADGELGTDTRLRGLRRKDDESQARLLRWAAYSKVDGVVTSGGNDQDGDLARRIEELAQQEIPVVTVEEDIENASRAAYIGPDPAEVGQKMEKMASDCLRKTERTHENVQSSILLLADRAGNSTQERWLRAFRDAASSDDALQDIRILVGSCGVEEAEVRHSIRQLLSDYHGISVICCFSTAASEHLGKLLSEESSAGEVSALTVGMSDRIREDVEEGRTKGTVFWDREREGYEAIRMLKKQLSRNPEEMASLQTVRSNAQQDMPTVYLPVYIADMDSLPDQKKGQDHELEWDLQ